MQINLKGGPFDGEILESDGLPPQFIVPVMHAERPVYRCTICQCCAAKEEQLDYVFDGYDRSFSRPAPKKINTPSKRN